MKPEEKQKYDALFDQIQHRGKISGHKVGIHLDPTDEIPPFILGQILKLSDVNQDGFLDRYEFTVAMHLAFRYLKGDCIPSTLPEELLVEKIPTPSFYAYESQQSKKRIIIYQCHLCSRTYKTEKDRTEHFKAAHDTRPDAISSDEFEFDSDDGDAFKDSLVGPISPTSEPEKVIYEAQKKADAKIDAFEAMKEQSEQEHKERELKFQQENLIKESELKPSGAEDPKELDPNIPKSEEERELKFRQENLIQEPELKPHDLEEDSQGAFCIDESPSLVPTMTSTPSMKSLSTNKAPSKPVKVKRVNPSKQALESAKASLFADKDLKELQKMEIQSRIAANNAIERAHQAFERREEELRIEQKELKALQKMAFTKIINSIEKSTESGNISIDVAKKTIEDFTASLKSSSSKQDPTV